MGGGQRNEEQARYEEEGTFPSVNIFFLLQVAVQAPTYFPVTDHKAKHVRCKIQRGRKSHVMTHGHLSLFFE